MIRVIVNEGENIEKALKKFKRKSNDTHLVKELRDRREFVKPSVAKRKQKLKAIYVQQLKNNDII